MDLTEIVSDFARGIELRGQDKSKLFAFVKKQYGIDDVRVIHGAVELAPGRRRTSELLADLESLLILRLDPSGNIHNSKSRSISRPGLTVECVGHWPHERTRFRDTG